MLGIGLSLWAAALRGGGNSLPANVVTYNGEPVTYNGEYVVYTSE